MKKYNVILLPSVYHDLKDSHSWGVKQWGVKQANQWLKEVKKSAMSLSILPERYPLAPENDQFEEEIRQLVLGRYRLLCSIEENTVYILHCIGGFTGK